MKVFSLSLASGQAGKRAYNCRLLAALFVSALSSLFVPLEQSQAQLVINVYPSQDNTNQTIWIFSGSSTARDNWGIRTSGNYSSRDTWETSDNNGNIYNANSPNNSQLSLSPLFSSSNTDDIASVRARIPGGGRTNITFAASATNTPTITIGSTSRTISRLFMDEDTGAYDDVGIRVSGSDLSYSTGNSSAWVGAGIISKPIGDFHAGTFNNVTGPQFASASPNSVRLVINSQVIPEPEEYALVFALFALGFVFFHRRITRKKQRQQAAAL